MKPFYHSGKAHNIFTKYDHTTAKSRISTTTPKSRQQKLAQPADYIKEYSTSNHEKCKNLHFKRQPKACLSFHGHQAIIPGQHQTQSTPWQGMRQNSHKTLIVWKATSARANRNPETWKADCAIIMHRWGPTHWRIGRHNLALWRIEWHQHSVPPSLSSIVELSSSGSRVSSLSSVVAFLPSLWFLTSSRCCLHCYSLSFLT